ncbi:MAG: 3-isopropylmalate dehydratase large subunit [Ardenticatenaceae bacterium]|nr:3-isopropylmalate dehydratase large subunit [Ardenticatenaceae bacterium]HBY95989.1 3-isopropylmalate dehydratase large subunit [Chloroflexota bacterium]
MKPRTMYEKIWDAHVVHEEPGQPTLLYVDLHLLHEVSTPQAFEGLRQRGRPVRRPELTLATMDHNVPTENRDRIGDDPVAARQMAALRQNCKDFGITLLDLHSPYQGIVHIIGPELGLTLPGMVIVCGDSHTSTHAAFGSLAFGIGTSESEHVLATQCVLQRKARTMQIVGEGTLPPWLTAKDVALAVIRKIGTGGATGHVIEYRGSLFRSLTMEERMTVCNMSIEAGARTGMIAPDETTFDYIARRPLAPKGRDLEQALQEWQNLPTDPGATFDATLELDLQEIPPLVTWGTTPAMSAPVTGCVPDPNDFEDPNERRAVERALEYMDLEPRTPIQEFKLDRVFIGSCTNARLSDLRAAAAIVRGKRVAPWVRAMVVPGSMQVKYAAEAEGLDTVFKNAGFEWRAAGCSMCVGMNADILAPGERCVSTSNRNFEGRQGRGGRSHLVSPIMAAAAAIAGHIVDVREWDLSDATV